MRTVSPLSPLRSQPDWARILGRPAAAPHSTNLPGLAGARVLVTGAGGFIGSEVVRLAAEAGAERIVLLEIGEQALFEVPAATDEPGGRCVPILGSVCDRALLAETFAAHRPQLVIHAAALKHVPLMERNPLAAVETNALGTWNVARAAEEHGASHMMLISTDKAVAPASIMGAAKRIAELVMLAPSPLRKTALRLVNVIGSPGSVGPIFTSQMDRGVPITVMHPEARRYFLTLDEVMMMLVEAMGAAHGGILLPQPGEPVRIADLAHRMIAGSGRDLPVVFTEPRPGEKLDEDLVADDERDLGPATEHLHRIASPPAAQLDSVLAALESAIATRNAAEMLQCVRTLVPGYEPGVLVREATLPHADAAASLA